MQKLIELYIIILHQMYKLRNKKIRKHKIFFFALVKPSNKVTFLILKPLIFHKFSFCFYREK